MSEHFRRRPVRHQRCCCFCMGLLVSVALGGRTNEQFKWSRTRSPLRVMVDGTCPRCPEKSVRRKKKRAIFISLLLMTIRENREECMLNLSGDEKTPRRTTHGTSRLKLDIFHHHIQLRSRNVRENNLSASRVNKSM